MTGATFIDLADGLRAWVRDSAPHERAAVDLLIWHERWLQRSDFPAACIRQDAPGTIARIDWGEARRFVDRGFTRLGEPRVHSTRADQRILAAVVATGLNFFSFPGMNYDHRDAIVQAFAAALGVPPKRPPGQPATLPPPFAVANAVRTAVAGPRDAERAQKALQVLGPDCPAGHRVVAMARIAHPNASWSQIADELGLRRDQVTSRFRRLVAAASKADAVTNPEGHQQ